MRISLRDDCVKRGRLIARVEGGVVIRFLPRGRPIASSSSGRTRARGDLLLLSPSRLKHSQHFVVLVRVGVEGGHDSRARDAQFSDLSISYFRILDFLGTVNWSARAGDAMISTCWLGHREHNAVDSGDGRCQRSRLAVWNLYSRSPPAFYGVWVTQAPSLPTPHHQPAGAGAAAIFFENFERSPPERAPAETQRPAATTKSREKDGFGALAFFGVC